MRYGAALSILFVANSAFASAAAALTCPATMSAALGPAKNAIIKSRLEQITASFHPDLGKKVPDEVKNTPGENFSNFQRADLIDPVRQAPVFSLDVYIGDYAIVSPDVFVLPRDGLLVCALSLGRMVFLSDGATHHYAVIYSIDYGRRTVTLIDPWSKVSFMRDGYNLLGLKARPLVGKKGTPLLQLKLGEFDKVIAGMRETINPELYSKMLVKLYPKILSDTNYLFWKFSRLLASNDFNTQLLASLQLNDVLKSVKNSRLSMLQYYANDISLNIFRLSHGSRSGVPAVSESENPIKDDLLKRVDNYAANLPWALKWILLERAAEAGTDTSVRLQIVDAYLKSDPQDVDFRIARARILMIAGKYAEGEADLLIASRQWRIDVTVAVEADSEDKAVQLVLASDFGLKSIRILKWRFARIELLLAEHELRKGQSTNADRRLDLLAQAYGPSLHIDFYDELLRISSLHPHAVLEEKLLTDAIIRTQNATSRRRLAEAIYEQFSRRQSVLVLSKSIRVALRKSLVGVILCGIYHEGRTHPEDSELHRQDLSRFCSV